VKSSGDARFRHGGCSHLPSRQHDGLHKTVLFLRDRADDFASLDATVVGISSQDLASHEAFTAKHALNVPLLADVDQDVARKYDAFSQRLGVKRAVIVIDEQGIVRHRHDHLLGLDYQSVDELKAALDALPAPATG
jgi:peroxiredoxin Q/BCP